MCRRIFKHQTSESGEIPFFKIGTFGGEPDAFITRELFEEFKAKYPYPDKGDILISASGSIGRTVEFTGENEYFQDSNIVWLKHDKSIINPFLRHLYSVVEWAGIEGSTIKRLYNDNILKTEVMLPSVQEQTKIAEMLDGIDSLITLHQRQRKNSMRNCSCLPFSWEQLKLGDTFDFLQNNTLSKEKFASGYLGYYMNSGSYHNQLLPLMQGIKVTSVSKSAISNTDISFPYDRDEQAEIGGFFIRLDNLITLHQC